MPTVHETGSAINVHNVLAKLATFAASIGWTIDKIPTHTGNMLGPNIKADDSHQTGYITSGTSPWGEANTTDVYSIENGVINCERDPGSYYYIHQAGYTPGDLLDVTIEVTYHSIGTLFLMFGDTTNRLSINGVRKWRMQYTMGAGGYIRFQSNDFIGKFKLISVHKIEQSVDQLSLHKDNVGFFNLVSHYYNVRRYESGNLGDPGPYIYLNSANSYDSSRAWDAQLGKSGKAIVNGLSPWVISRTMSDLIYAYYFFGNEKHIYIVLEIEPGEFSHFGFGNIRKYFDFRGGNFVYGTNFRFDTRQNDNNWQFTGGPFGQYNYHYSAANFLRADLLGNVTDRWLNDNMYSSPTNFDRLYGSYNGHTDRQYDENRYYGVAPLVPVYFAGEDINSYRYSLGEMEDYRITFCKYIDPLTVLHIDGGDWMIIPIKRKQLSTPAEYVSNTGNKALAYYVGPSI